MLSVEDVPVVVARNISLPFAGVMHLPTVETPIGKGKCIVTAPSSSPESSIASILS